LSGGGSQIQLGIRRGTRAAINWIERIHGRWFRLFREQFDTLHYAGMSIFKIGIILFNLAVHQRRRVR
jgi:hypothetical protein